MPFCLDFFVFYPFLCYRTKRKRQGYFITGKGFWRITIDITGHLVQQEDKGKTSVFFCSPSIKLAIQPLYDQSFELVTQKLVKIIALGKPVFGGNLFEPERQNLRDVFFVTYGYGNLSLLLKSWLGQNIMCKKTSLFNQ